MPTPTQRKASKSFLSKTLPSILAVSINLVAVLCAFSVLTAMGLNDFLTTPIQLSQIEAPNKQVAKVAFSAQQVNFLENYGQPDSFIILFFADDEQPDNRMEVWIASQVGARATFLNGEKIAEEQIPAVTEAVIASPYSPADFTAYAAFEDILAATHPTDLLVMPVETSLVPGGEIFFADRLTYGLVDDGLRYVEAIGFVPPETSAVYTGGPSPQAISPEAHFTITPGIAASPASGRQTLDESLLLMLSSQSILYGTDDLTAMAWTGGRLMSPASIGQVSLADINEHKMLADMYRRFASSLPENDPIRAQFEQNAQIHQEAADELGVVRRRDARQRNPFRRFYNATLRPIVRPLGKGAGFVLQPLKKVGGHIVRGFGRYGKVILILVKDEIIVRAKQIVRAKIDDIVGIVEGRADMVLQRLASKFGFPAAELIRQAIVDPALGRVRAQLQRALQVSNDRAGEPQAEADEESDDDYDPDFSNVDETGDTDYDDDEVSDTGKAGSGGEDDQDSAGEPYDVGYWFPEDRLDLECRSLAGEAVTHPLRYAEVKVNDFGYSEGVDKAAELYCDFRNEDLNDGFFIYVDAVDTSEGTQRRKYADWYAGYCTSQQHRQNLHEYLCGSEGYIEMKPGNELYMYTSLVQLDANTWTYIYWTHPPEVDHQAQIQALAAHIQAVLDNKRLGSP